MRKSVVSHSEKQMARMKFKRNKRSEKVETEKAVRRILHSDVRKTAKHKKSTENVIRRLPLGANCLNSHGWIEDKKWTAIRSLAYQHCVDDKSKKFISALFFCTLTCWHATSDIAIVSAIMQFVNSELSGRGGVVDDIWQILMKMKGATDVETCDFDTLRSHSLKDNLMTNISMLRSDWKQFKNMPLFNEFHHLLCALTVFGLLPPKNTDVNIGSIRLFSVRTQDLTMNAADAFDAVFNVVTYLFESGVYAFSTKSLRPFFFEDKEALEIDMEYVRLAPMIDHIVTGNLERLYSKTDKELEEEISDLFDRLKRLSSTVKGPMRQIILRKMENVARWLDKVIDARIACGSREAPYSPVIVGDSNIGKTSLTQVIAREIGVRQGFNTTARYQCVIQGNDKFWTSYKGYTEVVILDDFGNTKVDYMQEDEGSKQIMIKNNQMCYAPKADVSEKGRISVQPKLLLINSNAETMLSEMSVCPYSRYRRGDVYIRAVVRDEYARIVNGEKKNEIDAMKVQEMHARRDENGQYMLNERGMVIIDLPTLPNLWHITLQKPYEIKMAAVQDDPKSTTKRRIGSEEPPPRPQSRKSEMNSTIGWKNVTYKKDNELREAVDLTIFEALDVINSEANTFYSLQAGVVDMTHRMDSDYVLCPCGCGTSSVYCSSLKAMSPSDVCMESHSLMDFVGFAQREVTTQVEDVKFSLLSWFNRVIPAKKVQNPAQNIAQLLLRFVSRFTPVYSEMIMQLEETMLDFSNAQLLRLYQQAVKCSAFDITFWIPDVLYDSWLVRDLVHCIIAKRQVFVTYKYLLYGLVIPSLVSVIGSVILFWHYPFIIFSMCVLIIAVDCCVYQRLIEMSKDALARSIAKRNESLSPALKAFKKTYCSYIFYGLGIAVSIMAILKVAKSLREILTVESGSLLHPNSADDVTSRDALPNEWSEATRVNCIPGTATADQVLDLAKRNTFSARVHGTTGNRVDRTVVLHNGLCVLPKHSFIGIGSCFKLELRRDNWRVDIPLDETNTWLHPSKDIACVYSARIYGKNLLKHMRQSDIRDTRLPFQGSNIMYSILKLDNTWYQDSAVGYWNTHIRATEGDFCGWRYKSTIESQPGFCGSPMVVQTGEGWRFAGIHLAGKDSEAACGSVCLDDYQAACVKFAILPDIADEGAISNTVIGQHNAVKLDAPMDDSSPLKWREGDINYVHLGSAGATSKFYSSVEPSLIAETVEEVTGVKNNYGPPMTNPWYQPYHLDLDKRADQPLGFGISEITIARQDYVRVLSKTYNEMHPDVRSRLVHRPLDNVEIMFGIDGLKFVDRMNFATSLGFPYTGSKKKACILDGSDVPVDFEPWVWEEVAKVEQMLLHGQRANQPFKTSLKDEITKQYKDDGERNTKVRVFTCAPITLQILIRKYFLPVAAFMSRFPLRSEQAVGINASGPDFHELVEYLKVYGDKVGYVAGDFSKYDLGMSPDVILAAFGCMIDIARLMKYEERDLFLMQMIANEVANPVIAYHGELIRMSGSNPSGQNMTVYINGIVNAIYHRCVYNRVIKDKSLLFEDNVRVTFYGDDSLFAPSEQVSEHFHFNTLSREFARVGIKYTPADKSDSAPDFVTLENVDFLKRTPIYNSDLKMYLGALSRESILKSLFCSASDTLPPNIASGVNLDGSIREMFNHGRGPYEEWREKVQIIASRHNLGAFVNNLNVSYESYLANFVRKYCPEPESL
jgi:hypothetical protein